MQKNIQYIKEQWINFVENNKLNENIDSAVKDSWVRCKKTLVNYLTPSIKKVSKKELMIKLKHKEDLINIAKPIMENLYSIVAGSGFAIILTDKDGCILHTIGDEALLNAEPNFNPGVIWTEESIGTNAIGIVLYMDKPVQIIGAEHYYIKNHTLTCSAAAIHNEHGAIIGCINMSGNYSKANSHTTAIVASGAYSIEKQLALIKSNKLLNVIFESMSEGMLVLDENLSIKRTNKMACKTLGISENEILNMNVRSMLKNIESIESTLNTEKVYHNLDCSFYVNNRRIKCSVNAFPVFINDKVQGIVITFKDERYMHKVVNTIAGFSASYKFEDIITENEDMRKTIELAKRAALTSCNILIEGPSGTGKELFAQSVHNFSDRENGPFVAVNCASLPRELVESELFGYEKGAFTGATKEGHAGKFELANGGTIFLDEIGELPLDMQSKLLRVLDNNKITRVGGTYEKVLNVRVIAATNRNLIEEIEKKNFREDLYYRLNVMGIKTIPLKDRVEDIEILANYFIYRLNGKNPGAFKSLTQDYIDSIKAYSWSGNVRELRNVVERSYYLCEGNKITKEFLYNHIVKNEINYKEKKDTVRRLDDIEKESIENAIKQNNGDLVSAAKMLNISRATIYRKIKKYGI